MPMHNMFKKKNMQRKTKAKRIKKILLNMIESMFLGDVGVIGYTSKVIVPIKQLWLCVRIFDFSHISNSHSMRHLCILTMFSHTTHILFAIFDTCVGIMWFGHHKEYMC